MPHPRRLPTPKVPRFSNIVKSDTPAIQSPYPHENVNVLPSSQQQFNPRVAVYTLAFITVIVGGVIVGAKSKDWMALREVILLKWIDCSNVPLMKGCHRRRKLRSISISGC